jgi:hypothetical protein
MLRLLSQSPPVKRLLGRIMGLGFRREHIHLTEVGRSRRPALGPQ